MDRVKNVDKDFANGKYVLWDDVKKKLGIKNS